MPIKVKGQKQSECAALCSVYINLLATQKQRDKKKKDERNTSLHTQDIHQPLADVYNQLQNADRNNQ